MNYPQIIEENITSEDHKTLLNLHILTEPGTTEEVIRYLNEKKLVRVNGFRPGKVPKTVIERTLGKQTVYVDKMVEQYNIVQKSKNYHTVTEPELAEWNEEDNGSLKFKIKVELMPEFEIKESDYLGIEVEKDIVDPKKTEEVYENYLCSLEKQFGAYKPVERPAQIGDRIVLTMEGTIDNKTINSLTFKQKQLKLDEHSLGKEITETIVGVSPDETRITDVKFENNNFAGNLKDKQVKLTITLESIKELTLHPRNDDLAKQTNLQAMTLDELKTKFVEEYTKNANELIQRNFELACIEKVVTNTGLKIPDAMVNREVSDLLRYRMGMFQDMGLPKEQALQNLNYEVLADQAKKRVAAAIVFEKLINDGIFKLEDVSAMDIETEIKKKAEDSGQEVDAVRNNYSSQEDTLKKEVLYHRFIKTVVDNAKPKARDVDTQP